MAGSSSTLWGPIATTRLRGRKKTRSCRGERNWRRGHNASLAQTTRCCSSPRTVLGNGCSLPGAAETHPDEEGSVRRFCASCCFHEVAEALGQRDRRRRRCRSRRQAAVTGTAYDTARVAACGTKPATRASPTTRARQHDGRSLDPRFPHFRDARRVRKRLGMCDDRRRRGRFRTPS
jgi:hypothetical protein